MGSAEAAAADIFAQAMKTPSTEPLAKGGQNSNLRTKSALQVGEVFTFRPDLGKRGLRGSADWADGVAIGAWFQGRSYVSAGCTISNSVP